MCLRSRHRPQILWQYFAPCAVAHLQCGCDHDRKAAMTRNPDEWFRQQRSNWISVTKLREYYADFLFTNEGEDPQHEMNLL